MKKYMFMAVAGMLALSSCSSDDNEQTPQNTPRQMTFTAGFGDGTQTRTTLNADKSVKFDSGDAISIFSENNTNVQFTTTAGGATAEFTGTAVAGDATYYAVYPYNGSYTFSGGIVSGVTIEEYQSMNTFAGETWFKSSVISYATATGSDLEFHNACALLKITNNTGMYTEIHISAGESLVGTFNLDMSTGVLTATAGTNSVTTRINEDNATVYLAIAPGTYTNFTAAKRNMEDHGEWYSKTKASVTFQAGKIYDLGTTSSWMTQQAPAVESPLANTLTTADMTVKVNYNYNGGANYCLYVSNGDGTYLFSSGDGFAGGGSGAKELVVDNDGKLVFKQNFFDSIDDMWNMYGFSVTFDTSNNTYSQWVGEDAKNQFNPSFISVEVNGTEISLTPAGAETADVTWDFSELSGRANLDMEGYTNNGVTLQGTGNLDFEMNMLDAAGGCTFTAPTGKNFKKIVINATGSANIRDWTNSGDPGNITSTWTGNASHTVSFSGSASDISSIEFYLEDE